MMKKKTVRDIDMRDKRVLLRVDFNVPLDPESHSILDDSRIRAALPTIDYLRERGARIIACSHFGRPKGRDEALSLRPVAARLSELIGAPVVFAGDCTGPEAAAAAASLAGGDVALLENVRFHPEEEQNAPEFARELASLAEVYVNDAFGSAHRAHASTAGVAAYLPAVAGLLMGKEMDYLSRALDPEHPYAAIMGGAKVSSKMAVLESFLQRVDKLIIGGGMANTFLAAEGFPIGDSLVEESHVATALSVMERASQRGVKVLLPTDVIIADRFAADAEIRRASVKDVPAGWRIMDIGEMTVDVYSRALQGCKTVVWNGPMGVMELEPFSHGSHRLAGAIANLDGATTIVGGGETAAVVDQMGIASKFSHVSTGGGASLEFLEGRDLPGIAALLDA